MNADLETLDDNTFNYTGSELGGPGPDPGDLWEFIAEFIDDMAGGSGRFTYWDVAEVMLIVLTQAVDGGEFSADGTCYTHGPRVGATNQKLSKLLNAAIRRLRKLPVGRHWIHVSEREDFAPQA